MVGSDHDLDYASGTFTRREDAVLTAYDPPGKPPLPRPRPEPPPPPPGWWDRLMGWLYWR